ncbi:MAG: flavodoxin family protein [Candidatus Heimdallarchaeota archaeon]|nr:flavodoxin family protein [Candidatus Heimdallarchaeota archaeon]
MKALIAFFTMGGRTKRAAKAIASVLSKYEVEFLPIECKGNFIERIKMLDKFEKNDFSVVEEELKALKTANYDLIVIGMPTYGDKPPNAFNEIMTRFGKLDGKRIATYTTARFSGKKALEFMNEKIESVGGNITHTTKITRPFYLGKRKASKFGLEINEG